MNPSRKLFPLFWKFFVFAVLCLTLTPLAEAGDPGLPFPTSAASSDQKPGSILIYNVYTSGAANSNSHNSRIALTNSSDLITAYIHLFFVEGATCSVADSFICLTPNQTATFLASDIDPGITGYLILLAVNQQGCPVKHNFLLGDAYVKFPTGHFGNLSAESFAAQYDVFTGCNASSS